MKRLVFILLSLTILSSCGEDSDGVTRTYQEQLAFDLERIEGYIAENQLTGFQSTESGLHYKITATGNGLRPQPGNQVSVAYVGRTVEGGVFDQSAPGVPIEFILGRGQVIPGWDEGIQLVEEEGSATLILPSGLAYGTQNVNTFIGPNEILIFDVTLVDFQ